MKQCLARLKKSNLRSNGEQKGHCNSKERYAQLCQFQLLHYKYIGGFGLGLIIIMMCRETAWVLQRHILVVDSTLSKMRKDVFLCRSTILMLRWLTRAMSQGVTYTMRPLRHPPSDIDIRE